MKKVPVIILTLSLSISMYLLIDKFAGASVKKIGVISMEKLVYDFKGMKDATEKYTKKMSSWDAQTDSLEKKLQHMYNEIRIDSINKDRQKLNKDIRVFLVFKQSYMEYVQNIQAKAEKEDKNMTVGVMNQINEYIKSFAKEEGFDLILCNNAQYQNVGFSKDGIDVTQRLLEYANKKYAGEK